MAPGFGAGGGEAEAEAVGLDGVEDGDAGGGVDAVVGELAEDVVGDREGAGAGLVGQQHGYDVGVGEQDSPVLEAKTFEPIGRRDEVQFGDRHTGDPNDPRGLPGFPCVADTLARWSELSGYSSDGIDYYVALAGYKYAICAVRYVSLMTAAGMPPEAAQYADGMRLGAEKVLNRPCEKRILDS